MPRLRLGNKTENRVQRTGPHRVKFLMDKEATGIDTITGKEIPVVAYMVEENGEKKSYRVPKLNKSGEINYLVIRLAEIEEGQEAILEMKRSGIKNYVDVIPVKLETSVPTVDYDDIPIIDENENEQTTDSKAENVESEK